MREVVDGKRVLWCSEGAGDSALLCLAGRTIMSDLLFVGIVIVFFIISGLYVRFCEKL
jgi:hypothetical protein